MRTLKRKSSLSKGKHLLCCQCSRCKANRRAKLHKRPPGTNRECSACKWSAFREFSIRHFDISDLTSLSLSLSPQINQALPLVGSQLRPFYWQKLSESSISHLRCQVRRIGKLECDRKWAKIAKHVNQSFNGLPITKMSSTMMSVRSIRHSFIELSSSSTWLWWLIGLKVAL